VLVCDLREGVQAAARASSQDHSLHCSRDCPSTDLG
jgi:hypothetical protein